MCKLLGRGATPWITGFDQSILSEREILLDFHMIYLRLLNTFFDHPTLFHIQFIDMKVFLVWDQMFDKLIKQNKYKIPAYQHQVYRHLLICSRSYHHKWITLDFCHFLQYEEPQNEILLLLEICQTYMELPIVNYLVDLNQVCINHWDT